MIPQLITIVLTIIGLTITATKHGEPKNDRYNFWVSLASYAITYLLLWWGGFFEVLG